MWLQAGIVASIKCELDDSDILLVQIGAHSESLISEPGPWKRWPCVVSAFKLQSPVTQIASQFGGIVYIAVTSTYKKKLLLNFHRFSKHPIYSDQKPNLFSLTKNNIVPWGEISCELFILTIPREYLLQIEDIPSVTNYLSNVIKTVSSYMNYIIRRAYRIVFDIQTPGNSHVPGYPIVMNINDINGLLLSINKATPQLFSFVIMIATVSIREGCFDEITERALAYFVATSVFVILFEGFLIDEVEGYFPEIPPLFAELWHIQKEVSPSIIKTILERSQDPDTPTYEVAEDKWISFIRDLCKFGRLNFTRLLEKARPIPLNMFKALEGLPMYIPQNLTSSFEVIQN